ncbi:hypothetical protein ACGFIF_38105 [Kribbella sp. NPDC049174]|uniref:hypothetical protein n=1 Tax=Kribbella sp. NPDC049174 TaxID=3364112 RepID=UPI003717A979
MSASVLPGETPQEATTGGPAPPERHLEAVLAHEPAHHLAVPRALSLLLYWLTLPARLMGRVIVFCLRHRMLSILAKIVIGFLLLGVLGVWFFLGFSHYVVFMLSPFLAPFRGAVGQEGAGIGRHERRA